MKETNNGCSAGWGGAREGAGRPKNGDPTKKFSVSAHDSEYRIIEHAAAQNKKSISRYLIDLALKDASE